jgi:hypothetical protein
MVRKNEEIAGLLGRNQDVVDMLETLLTGPDDRAYIVCSAVECRNNVQGRCTIHAVKNGRALQGNGRCSDYVV